MEIESLKRLINKHISEGKFYIIITNEEPSRKLYGWPKEIVAEFLLLKNDRRDEEELIRLDNICHVVFSNPINNKKDEDEPFIDLMPGFDLSKRNKTTEGYRDVQ